MFSLPDRKPDSPNRLWTRDEMRWAANDVNNRHISHFLFCSIRCAAKSESTKDIYFCPISGDQDQQPAFKPAGFGAAAQPAVLSGLFRSSTPVFRAATDVAPATSAFGQPQQQAADTFGQPQAEPVGKKPLFFSGTYFTYSADCQWGSKEDNSLWK